ncbi:hypothetical protein J2S09_005497 [Bacillus fengqiuensis]|nr:hypothetical protein [Bacillus fengqiuensis]
MKIDIGVLPHKYISKNNSGDLFPSVIYSKVPSLISVGFFERKNEEIEKFVSNWMNELNRFPIYALFRCYKYQQENFEKECLTHSIEYQQLEYDNSDNYNKVTINSILQFNAIFPYLYGNGCMNNFASWSLNEDVYKLENRIKIPIVTLKEDTTLFWIDYDGSGLVVVSNDKKYSKLSFVLKILPEETDYSIVEFGE